MKPIQRIAAIILVICTSVCFSSCYRPGSLGSTGYYEAYAIARHAVPFFVDIGSDASNFDKVKLLEKDDYGRKLFAYNYWLWPFATENVQYATLLVVCQSTSGDKKKDMVVSWYDECWLAKPSTSNKYASFDNAEIEKLKEQNDWGQPLNELKMNTAHYYTYDSYRSDEENAKYNADQTEKTEDMNNLVEAANIKYSTYDRKAIGTTVYKHGCIFSIVVISDNEMFFVCFDPLTKEFKREEQFSGNIFKCRDAFCVFMNRDG